MSNNPIEIFYCYSHIDENLQLELVKHLSALKRQGIISDWYDRKISPGREWKGGIDNHLDSAKIILPLVSPDFLASDYCYDVEMMRALKRHKTGDARVIPIILRACDWKDTPLGKLQALPKDGKPVTSWNNIDEAFLDIVKGLRRVCAEIQSEQSTTSGTLQDSGGYDNSQQQLASIIICSRCGASTGEGTICAGVYIEHDFRQYKGNVYCSRCGIQPGKSTTCTGIYFEHAFRQYEENVFCSRCGVSPGESTSCTGIYIEHLFKQYRGKVICRRCGSTPGKSTTCTGIYIEHDFREFS